MAAFSLKIDPSIIATIRGLNRSKRFVYVNMFGSKPSARNPLGLVWTVYKSRRNSRFTHTVRTLHEMS